MTHKQSVSLLRVFHGGIVLYLFFCIGYVYYASVIKLSNGLVWITIVSLIVEGVIIYVNKGHCPLIFVQRKFGDTTPFFDLILPHKYARYAVKFCAVISFVGIIAYLFRVLS